MDTLYQIKGFERLYSITKDGRIWSHEKSHDCGRGYICRYKGRWMNPSINSRGYRVVQLRKEMKYYRFLVHRLVLLTFTPNPENKPFCNHKDCNTLNNHVDNLEWCTNKENIIHAYKNGLMNITDKMRENLRYYGIKNQHHTLKATRKFTYEQIEKIKQLYQELKVYSRVARIFNCSYKTIEKIVNNKSYQTI